MVGSTQCAHCTIKSTVKRLSLSLDLGHETGKYSCPAIQLRQGDTENVPLEATINEAYLFPNCVYHNYTTNAINFLHISFGQQTVGYNIFWVCVLYTNCAI